MGYDTGFNPVDGLIIPLGTAFWLESTGTTNFTTAGDVPTVGTITNSIIAGFNLIANPYPTELTLGSIPSAAISDLDNIYTWDGTNYTTYTYYDAGNGWYDTGFNSASNISV